MLDQYQKLGDTVFAILSLDVNDINLQQKQKCESLRAVGSGGKGHTNLSIDRRKRMWKVPFGNSSSTRNFIQYIVYRDSTQRFDESLVPKDDI